MRRRKRRKHHKSPRKSTTQKLHAYRRLAERFGITLRRSEYDDLVHGIQGGRYEMIEKQSSRITVWRVKVRGIEMPAVYDKKRHVIVTFLPDETRVGELKEKNHEIKGDQEGEGDPAPVPGVD